MAKEKSGNISIHNVTLEGNTGSVNIVVEVPRTETQARRYQQALKDARHIPFDLNAINPLDPMYRYVLEKFPLYVGKPELQRQQVRNFYEIQSEGAFRDAIMLALIAAKDEEGNFTTVFEFPPTPYEEGDGFEDDDLPGLVSPPKVTPDITNPTEYRLKQFYDWLKANPEHLLSLNPAFELAAIKINEMTMTPAVDGDGFRVKSAS